MKDKRDIEYVFWRFKFTPHFDFCSHYGDPLGYVLWQRLWKKFYFRRSVNLFRSWETK